MQHIKEAGITQSAYQKTPPIDLNNDNKELLALKEFALDQVCEGVLLVDTTGRILYVNQRACQQLEYTQTQLLNLSLQDIDQYWSSKFSRADWIDLWNKMQIDGGIIFETKYQTSTGRFSTKEVTAYSVVYANTPNILLLVRDVSEHKEKEKELINHREHLEELVLERTAALNQALSFTEGIIQAIPDLLFELDQQGRHLNIWTRNTELQKSLRHKLLGRTVSETLPPDAATSIMMALSKAATNQSAVSFGETLKLHLPTGTRWFDLSVSQYTRKLHNQSHFLVLSRDISERVKTEQAMQQMNTQLKHCIRERNAQLESANHELRSNELEYRSLVESLPDIVIRYNTQCQMIYCNPIAMQELSHYNQPILGKKPEEILKNEGIKKFQKALQRVINSKKPAQIEIDISDFNDKIRTYQIRFIHEQTPEGKTLGALAICRDITEQVRTLRKLAESHMRQRELISQREADLDQERRHIAREIHDELGQILTALKLGISTIKMQQEYKNSKCKKNINHLIELTDQAIKTVRTISSSLRPAILDMGIITAMQGLIAEFQQQNRLNCKVNLPDELNSLHELQAMALFRTLQEALTNITRHADANFTQIDLKTESSEMLLLQIKDDGKGFYLHTESSGHFGLIGMRERINSLGGTLTIDSTPGSGTCIQVCLPYNHKCTGVSDQ